MPSRLVNCPSYETLWSRTRSSPGVGPDGRQGSVGAACAAPPCEPLRLRAEGKDSRHAMTSIFREDPLPKFNPGL